MQTVTGKSQNRSSMAGIEQENRKMKRYYSAESAHGSESSHGFSNDTIVFAFNSPRARDDYVTKSRNISCRAILAREVTKYATNFKPSINRTNAPRPFSGEFWAIIDAYTGGPYTGGPIIPGLLGYVGVPCSDEPIIERLHK